MRYNKLAYLLKRHAEEKTEGYRKKAAGPYNPDMRYSGAEDIAVKKQYMKWMDTGTYKGYVAHVNQQEARKYFYRWYGQEALDWLKSFKYKTKDTLELWTTVDYAIWELEEKGEAVSVASVRSVLANHEEWQEKLERDLFSDTNIESAIQKVERLFG